MTRYKETVEQSAEYLRLALPLMSRQAGALHPISYSIWYEYVAGINKPLRNAIDKFAGNGKVLDEAMTQEIYLTYIAQREQQAAHRVVAGFSKVMADVSQDAANADMQVHRFGHSLEQWTKAQAGAMTSSLSQNVLGKLLMDTHEMQGAMTTLQDRLDSSQKEIERLQQEVIRAREEALADELTGLVNRRGFEKALADCLANDEPQARDTCLLFADIDHFKRVNDTYGHLMGDKVLRAVAQILRANTKGKDTAARFGGEEFVVLLPETGMDGAKYLAEKIRSTIEKSRIKRVDTQQEMAQITISLGIARYCAGESPADFVARGDAALYAAKTQGRNRVTVAPARPLQ